MTTPNGTDTRTTREQLREARARVGLRRAELELSKLDRVKKLMEGQSEYGWVGAYRELYDRWRAPDSFAPGLAATAGDRRRGKNWPLFQTEAELAILRQASRVMASTNDYGLGLLSGVVAYVIGGGCSYRAAPRRRAQGKVPGETLDALCAEIDYGLETFQERCEWFGGEAPGIEVELVERWVTDGEFIVRQWADDDGGTDVRVVEPERLTQPPGEDEREWSFGVRTDPDDVQRVLGYWIFDGDDPAGGEEYDPDQVTHCRKNVPRSVKRGMPDFSWGTYDALERSARLNANMTEGAAVQAAIAWIEQHESATKEEVADMRSLVADWQETNQHTGRTENVSRAKPGTVFDINKGRTFLPSPISQYLQTLVPILEASLRSAGRRWNAPQWMCSGDNSSVNFASSLTAESPFVRRVLLEQGRIKTVFARIHEVAVKNLCDAGKLVAAGRAWGWDEVRSLVRVECTAPSPETRDKDREALRRKTELDAGAYSVQQWCADEGRDYDQVQAERLDYARSDAARALPPAAGGTP